MDIHVLIFDSKEIKDSKQRGQNKWFKERKGNYWGACRFFIK